MSLRKEGFFDNLKEPYIISEIGLNHNGSKEEAYKLIDASKEAGCNAAKFQIRSNSCINKDITEMEIGQQYVQEYIKSTFLSYSDYQDLFEHTRQIDLDLIVSCWDIESLIFAKQNNIEILKIASADLTNILMIDSAFKYFDNFIMSTGMSTQSEIVNSVKNFNDSNKNLCLLHCQSAYPAPVNTLNLNYLSRLKELFPNLTLGYSGHELEYHVCLTALGLGAIVFEKHLTLNKEAKGNDHVVSLYPDEMKKLSNMLKNAYESLGVKDDRVIQPGEKANRISLGKSLTVNKPLNRGDKLKKEDLDFTYGGKGLTPDKYMSILDKKLLIPKTPGELIESCDFEGEDKEFIIDYPPIAKCTIGIPVRYHDAVLLYKEIKPEFLEFHLSYKDIDFPITKIENLFDNIPKNLLHTFHAPDFYKNDLIFDPFSRDSDTRSKSIIEFQRFLTHINKLLDKSLFDDSRKIPIVTSFSCATLKEFFDKDTKTRLYESLFILLKKIEKQFPKLKVLPQTLPVNAWYLGGRRLVNIFADPREILDFCETYNIKICLDTAHTIMSSNFYGLNPNEYIKKLLPFAEHIHLVDAQGDSDEGLLFGEGDLNLEDFAKEMSQIGGLSYIPEIWQGHHNKGEGFKSAIKTLINLK